MKNNNDISDLIGDSNYITLGNPNNAFFERDYIKGFKHILFNDNTSKIELYILNQREPISYYYGVNSQESFKTDVNKLQQQFK